MNRKDRRTDKARGRAPEKSGHSFLNAQNFTEQGLQHHLAGRLAEAEHYYRQALAIDPNDPDALHLTGVLANEIGRHDIAVELISKAIKVRSDIPFFYNNLGNALNALHRIDEAEKGYRHAIALKPDYAEAMNNLGNVLRDRRDYKEALVYYLRSIALNPGLAETHHNLGTIYRHLGQDADAYAAYIKALEVSPGNAEAHLKLGCLYLDQGSYADAMVYFERSIALKPDYSDAYLNLGHVMQNLDRLEDAEKYFRRSVELDPKSASPFNNLGNVLVRQGRLDEAMNSYRSALKINPKLPSVYSNLLLAMVYASSVTPEDLAETAREFGEKVANPLRRDRPFPNTQETGRKLRIGYVSPDFRDHAVNYFFEPLLKSHDRERFEIFGYSNVKPIEQDAVTARLKKDFSHWRDIVELDDDQAADLIERDQIDILIDLAGHTANNRLMVFARKPAPVQVTWMGFVGTTGMDAIDYRVTDQYAEPPGMTEHLSIETLWRLPEIFSCYSGHESRPAVIDHPPAEDNGYITFGSFNNFAKLTDPVLSLWAEIMRKVPDSRLLLVIAGIDDPDFRSDVEIRFKSLGFDVDRLIFYKRSKANQFVLYNKVDIVLDPFPCNGGTTSMDSMWMGVPMVTLEGQHFISRIGVTILTNAGMPELIAKTAEDYVSLAVRLATDREWLRRLRSGMRERVEKSPLMDQQRFARNMEDAYRGMWRIWCEKQST